jgi:hypothetical protein
MHMYLSAPSRSGQAARRTVLLAGTCVALAAGALGAGSAQAATLPTISATVSASTITVTGALQSGAVNVASTATGGKEPSVVLFALKPGVSLAEFYAYLNENKTDDPNTANKYGSIVFDAEAGKGKATEAQTVLAPGQYVAVNAEAEKSSTWPRASLAIAAAPSPAALPAAQATEKTIEYAFKGPKVLHVGELVRFENEGYLVHMDYGIGAKSAKAAAKIAKAVATGQEKGVGKLVSHSEANFAGPVSAGAFQQAVITAKPGWYVQVCFMPTQDGRPHVLLGMERVIKIVK